jgi:hypothetical protein
VWRSLSAAPVAALLIRVSAAGGGWAQVRRSQGANWSTAQNIQRVHEYAVDPTILQNLPGNALLFPASGTPAAGPVVVECDPQITTLPGMVLPDDHGNVGPANSQDGWPELAPPQQPAWQPRQDSPAGNEPAWPSQPPHWRWPPQHG